MSATADLLQQRYELVRLIAQGGMGAVYQGRDWRLGGSLVALKQSRFVDEQMRAVFEREANLLARLSHPCLPKVRDLFTSEYGQYIVMEFIPGHDLEEALQQHQQPIQPSTVLAWADQILDALEYLHSSQPPVIHRDIKPNNLKLTPQGHLMLLDFGLSKGETASFSVHGYTSAYAPIEQIRNSGTDARSDIYSLGATLFRLLTNRLPENAITRLEAIALGQPDPQRLAHELNPNVPLLVSHVLNRAMQLNRDARFHNAREMRLSLRMAIQTAPPTPQPNFDTTVPTPQSYPSFPSNPFQPAPPANGAYPSSAHQSGAPTPPRQNSGGQALPPARPLEAANDPFTQQTINEEHLRRSDAFGATPPARPTQPLPPAQPSQPPPTAQPSQPPNSTAPGQWPEQRPQQWPSQPGSAWPANPPAVARPPAQTQPVPPPTLEQPLPAFYQSSPNNPVNPNSLSNPGNLNNPNSLSNPGNLSNPGGPGNLGNPAYVNSEAPVQVPAATKLPPPFVLPITLTPSTTKARTPWLKYVLTSGLLLAIGAACVLVAQQFWKPAATLPPTSTPPKTFTNSAGMTFQLIPAGSFQMGSLAEKDSQPVHSVTFAAPFYLSQHETTQEQWQALMKSNPSRFKGTNLPVESVSFNDVQQFLAALNRLEDGYEYRLPSEAEWEYAARAGQTGDALPELAEQAWYEDNTNSTRPVGQKKANAFGLYDMFGNVAEWCADNWHDNYRGAPADGSVWLATGANRPLRVIRGENWYSPANQITRAYRNYEEASQSSPRVGFRLTAQPRQLGTTAKPATP